MDALAPPQLDARALEEILTEVGRQLLAGRPLAGLAPWGAATVSVEVSAASAREVVSAGACRLGMCGPDPARLGDLASHIDHTLLKPDATAADVDKLCAEALEHGFASVCINGTWVRRCAEILLGSKVLVCTVVGFPLGASASEVKAYEARRAIEDGACEVDMVLNVGALKSGDHGYVQRDVAMVAETCHRLGARLKVILETCLLTREEIVKACELAKAAGADFVKTSTGFSTGGATVEQVELMRRTVGPVMGVKASGGVRDTRSAEAMLAAGATRIGASASVAIVKQGTRASATGY
jgi:deoxyribose-phosphate aldolase